MDSLLLPFLDDLLSIRTGQLHDDVFLEIYLKDKNETVIEPSNPIAFPLECTLEFFVVMENRLRPPTAMTYYELNFSHLPFS